MASGFTLPPRPQSTMVDNNGNVRPEWLRWFDAVDRILRALDV